MQISTYIRVLLHPDANACYNDSNYLYNLFTLHKIMTFSLHVCFSSPLFPKRSLLVFRPVLFARRGCRQVQDHTINLPSARLAADRSASRGSYGSIRNQYLLHNDTWERKEIPATSLFVEENVSKQKWLKPLLYSWQVRWISHKQFVIHVIHAKRCKWSSEVKSCQYIADYEMFFFMLLLPCLL